MKKKEQHHFLTTIRICGGRYSILSAIPGQTLKGEPLVPGLVVKGCEKYRKSFPDGSVFGTTTLQEISKYGVRYEVSDLFFLGDDTDARTGLFDEALRQQLKSEYDAFREKELQ